MPPNVIFVHTLPNNKMKDSDGPLALMCLEIQVAIGGLVSVKLHMPEGHAAPCSDDYASAIMSECRHVPLALTYILPPMDS